MRLRVQSSMLMLSSLRFRNLGCLVTDKPFAPMLAADCNGDTSKLKYPLLASPKIDGIRCVIRGGKALTRSLKPVPNDFIRNALSKPEFNGFDGELVWADDPTNFQATSSAVMKKTGEPNVWFWVFDLFEIGSYDFWTRLPTARLRVNSMKGAAQIDVVEHVQIDNEEALLAFEAECLAEGYEGVMLRDPNGKYKHGRSTLKEGGLVKLKRFEDAEAVIVGFEERMHNGNEAYKDELGRTKRSSAQEGKVGRGDLGAFVLESANIEALDASDAGEIPFDWTPVRFTCGSGLTDAQRIYFWARRDELLGKTVKYKFLRHGMKDAPRHPVFLGIRDERDL